MAVIPWDGPLFYPPVGAIAVTDSGERIEIHWNESEHPGCFTGLLLKDGRTYTQRIVFDLSVMWDRSCIDHCEEPTETDRRLMMFAEVA